MSGRDHADDDDDAGSMPSSSSSLMDDVPEGDFVLSRPRSPKGDAIIAQFLGGLEAETCRKAAAFQNRWHFDVASGAPLPSKPGDGSPVDWESSPKTSE